MSRIRQRIRRWLALKEMGGLNPFYSPSLVWRESSEEAMSAMQDVILDDLAEQDTSIAGLFAKVEQARFQGEERIKSAVVDLEEAERRVNSHRRRIIEKMRVSDGQI